MKKILIISVLAFSTLVFVTSCTKDCKKCKTVTSDNTSGAQLSEGSSSEYCDTDLDNKESAEPVNDGSTTTKWVCQ